MMMDRYDSTRPETDALVARVRALIERSSLGEEAPRQLRNRARPEQLLGVRQLLWQRASSSAGPVPEEAVADRLIRVGCSELPARCPGLWMLTTGGALPVMRVSYADPAYRGQYRNDSATMTRVAAGLRRLTTCSS